MIKDAGSFEKESCRAFGLAAHTLAALMATVIHNLGQTGRTRNRKNNNPNTPARADHTPSDTTAASSTPHLDSRTSTRAPP